MKPSHICLVIAGLILAACQSTQTPSASALVFATNASTTAEPTEVALPTNTALPKSELAEFVITDNQGDNLVTLEYVNTNYHEGKLFEIKLARCETNLNQSNSFLIGYSQNKITFFHGLNQPNAADFNKITCWKATNGVDQDVLNSFVDWLNHDVKMVMPQLQTSSLP